MRNVGRAVRAFRPGGLAALSILASALLIACGGTAATPSASSAPASAAAAVSVKPAAQSQAAGAPAGASSAAKPSSAVSAPTAAGVSDADWPAVLDAAKKEGHVIVWGENGPAGKAFEKDAFEKAYPGITVDLFQANTQSERDQRFIQEYKAGVAKVDVEISGSAGVNANIKPQGMLQDIHPFLRPQILDPKNWLNNEVLWVDKEHKYMIQGDTGVLPIVTNKSLAPDITSWSDLVDPKFKGKIVMTDPRQSGGGFAMGVFMYNALGSDFTSKFYGNSPVFSPDEQTNIEWVDSGKMLAGVGTRPIMITNLLKVGGTVRPHASLKAPDGGAIASYSGSSGILFLPNLNPLPDPNATKVYVNWFYSKEGQQAMVDILNQPTHRVDVDMSKLPDWAVPKAGVKYMDLNDEQYTATGQVKAMRDDVNKWYKAP